jgi:DNA polymerase-3 subunit alpha
LEPILSRNHAPQSRDENRVNKTLIEFAQKHEVKLIASNNTYYLNKEDANAHDILLCVKDGEKQATPIGRGRGYRYGLPNQDTTTNQMRR